MSIGNSLNGLVGERVLDTLQEEHGLLEDRDESLRDDAAFVRECDDVGVILWGVSWGSSEDGLLEMREWERREEYAMATRVGEDWVVLYMSRKIEERVIRIAKAQPKSVEGLMKKKRVIQAYLDRCENADDPLVQLTRGLCNNLI